MRLWSLHPRYLDRQGLTACWREALLAQAVLAERTKGYRHHPQLRRFREQSDPLATVGAYLSAVAEEATIRSYNFNRALILRTRDALDLIEVTRGQLDYECQHLLAKLEVRSPDRIQRLTEAAPTPHPLFAVVPGPVAEWEIR